MSFLTLLPLRTTTTDDSSTSSAIDFSALENLGCDVARLSRLRETCASCFRDNNHAAALSNLETLQEYAAALNECLQHHDIVTSDKSCLKFAWKWNTTATTTIEEEASMYQYVGGWKWERRNVILNIAIVHAYQASTLLTTTTTTTTTSASVSSNLQHAATLANHLALECEQEDDDHGTSTTATQPCDLTRSYFVWLEHYLLGEAQRFMYKTFAEIRQPKQFVLAKVAAACIPLYQTAVEAITSDDVASSLVNNKKSINKNEIYRDVARSWGMYFDAVSEYHQALAHAEKKEAAACVTRLTAALRFASLCSDFCQNCSNNKKNDIVSRECYSLTTILMHAIDERLSTCEKQQQEDEDVLDRDELGEIKPQQMVKVSPQSLSTLLTPLPPPPLFRSIPVTTTSTTAAPARPTTALGNVHSTSNDTGNPAATTLTSSSSSPPPSSPRQKYQQWKHQSQARVEELAQWVQEQSDAARHALGLVSLPHSLTAYRQQISGGGIPVDLWMRVEEVQQTQKDERLKSQLWHLRDDSEKALHIYQDIQSQLDEDLETDRQFRLQHADFRGHDVQQVQVHFRQALDNYSRLMTAAQESDRVLGEKLQILETDPKFLLLKFQKTQLDHLLPMSSANAAAPPIDVTELSHCLVDLSEQLEERDSQVGALQDYIHDTASKLESITDGSGGDLDRALDAATRHVKEQVHQIESSAAQQKGLVHHILQLNIVFMSARQETSAAVSSSNILVKLDDALEELDEFTTHLKEGTAFYDVIIPKLKKLRHNVGDVSARLTVERCEFEDMIRRSRQEEEDAFMAATLADPLRPASTAASPTSSPRSDAPAAGGPSPPPGVEQVSHDARPAVRVDDEKVASLVAMDFDPDRVVAALRMYNNDMDQAVNELLRG